MAGGIGALVPPANPLGSASGAPVPPANPLGSASGALVPPANPLGSASGAPVLTNTKKEGVLLAYFNKPTAGVMRSSSPAVCARKAGAYKQLASVMPLV